MAIYTFSQISSYSAKSRPPNSDQCVGTRMALNDDRIADAETDLVGCPACR
jgi:hypothetical protein